MRFPAMCMGGMALWVTYLFGARVYSRRAGAVAAASFALMPHVFFHAHLACFDVPIAAMWTACIYVYWRTLTLGVDLRWPEQPTFASVAARLGQGAVWTAQMCFAGAVFGLTLDTKHNAWFLPFVFVAHALFAMRRNELRQLRLGQLPMPWNLVFMATVGPMVFYALWPLLWSDSFTHLQRWVEFHLGHEYYNMEFLGVNYYDAPSPVGYLPFMLIATVPAITLLLFVIGAGERAWLLGRRAVRGIANRFSSLAGLGGDSDLDAPRDSKESDVLFFLAIGAAFFPWLFLPKTPIFGGTKHWMPAYPFLALFAGRGFDMVWAAMGRALEKHKAHFRYAAQAGLVLSVLVGPLVISAHSGAFGLGAYVPLVGGVPGAATLGLNRSFWGYMTQNASEEYLAANARQGASVFIHDTGGDAWHEMVVEKRVRPDLQPVGGAGDGEYAIIHHELHMNEVEYQVWVAYGTLAPVYVVMHDGVPMVSIYKRP